MCKVIYLAGGCFWGTEHYISLVNGITETCVGYANGKTQNPTYEQVCNENTGYAEAVKVDYDENVISLDAILQLYYDVINPVAVNKQGEDNGDQYRTGIYYVDDSDVDIITNSIEKLQTKFQKPIAIEIKPLENFFIAEDYHQKYLVKNPNGYCHIGKDKFDVAKAANRG